MTENIEPIDGDGSDDRTYIQNDRKAPPWVVVHEADPDDPMRDEFDKDPNDELYYYHKGAGPKLVKAVREQHPEFEAEQLREANSHVISDTGDEIRDGVENGEIDPEPIMAAQDTIAKFATVSADDGAYPEADHVDALVDGWNDGGHWELERVYFKKQASKISVACALHRLRDELKRADPQN